jgi:cullin 3
MTEYLVRSFNGELVMDNCINDGFCEFINTDKRVSHQLNRFLDKKMREDFTKMTPEEFEKDILQIIKVFQHIRDSDYFETIYKNSLAKRLLEANYIYEAEREVIKLLKKDKGATYTQKMETMFQDIKNSSEMLAVFKEKDNFKALPIEFDAKVLTGCSWPIRN